MSAFPLQLLKKMLKSRFFFNSFAALGLVLSGCGSLPVRSTVDAYGDAPVENEKPLCFIRESAPLLDRPIVDACQKAAEDRGLRIGPPGSKDCTRVLVSTGLSSSSHEITTGSSFGGFGLYGGGLGLGLGMGFPSTEVKNRAAREINVRVFSDPELKKPLREIVVRSAGRENSVSVVAPEMCEAAFRDYPRNLRGETYEIKRRE